MDLACVQAHIQQSLPGLIAIYLFGSQATGEAIATSDVDLAILVQGKIEPLRLWELAGELADLVHRPVDLVDLRAASTVMQHQIVSNGHRLWACPGIDAGTYELFIFSEKMKLDEARAGLLDDISKDGRIYGR
jgi:predicted nucleotidyltransferase